MHRQDEVRDILNFLEDSKKFTMDDMYDDHIDRIIIGTLCHTFPKKFNMGIDIVCPPNEHISFFIYGSGTNCSIFTDKNNIKQALIDLWEFMDRYIT